MSVISFCGNIPTVTFSNLVRKAAMPMVVFHTVNFNLYFQTQFQCCLSLRGGSKQWEDVDMVCLIRLEGVRLLLSAGSCLINLTK